MFSTGNARVAPSRLSSSIVAVNFESACSAASRAGRILSLAQRVGAGAQKVLRGLGDLFERLAQTRDRPAPARARLRRARS